MSYCHRRQGRFARAELDRNGVSLASTGGAIGGEGSHGESRPSFGQADAGGGHAID